MGVERLGVSIFPSNIRFSSLHSQGQSCWLESIQIYCSVFYAP